MSFLKNIFRKARKVETDEADIEKFFAKHKDRIYPWVKVLLSDSDLQESDQIIELEEEESPIFNNWLDDLTIYYVIDRGESFQVLLRRDLPKAISREKLHSLAVENLNRDIEFILHETEFGAYMVTAGGNHEAGSICLPWVWQWFADRVNDNLVVAIPAKDLVLFVPGSDTDSIDKLKEFVGETLHTGNRLLTRTIFQYDKETTEWTVFDRLSEKGGR